MTDGELLAEFARARSETAFAELVRRHGAMVRGACRRVTASPELAEEAAQAVFLILARKAAKVAGRPDAGAWLHRTAGNVARWMKRSDLHRRAHEKEAIAVRWQQQSQPTGTGRNPVAELSELVDAELDRLPEAQRQVVVGLHLEGRTQAELAEALGVPEGTVAWRAKVAIEKLRARLGRRGVTLGAAALGPAIAGLASVGAGAATVPASLASLPSLAAAFAAKGVAGSAGLPAIASAKAGAASWSLAEGAIKAMFWMKVKVTVTVVTAAVAVGTGAGVVAHRMAAAEPAKESTAEPIKGLSDEQMRELAEATARTGPFVSLDALASKNPHLGGEKAIPNPLANTRFWCVLQGHTPAAPRRAFICVDRSGNINYPFTADGFGKLLAAEKTADWKDEAFLEAAQLYVHLTSLAHQDGLKFCNSADDFMAVTFNMPKAGPADQRRREVAREIEAPNVVKADGKTIVTFYAWHLIGGALKQWIVEFSPEFKAESKELGRFGGGGYD